MARASMTATLPIDGRTTKRSLIHDLSRLGVPDDVVPRLQRSPGDRNEGDSYALVWTWNIPEPTEQDSSELPEQLPSPHSRACGIVPHEHGPACHATCPTCSGGRIDGNFSVADHGWADPR